MVLIIMPITVMVIMKRVMVMNSVNVNVEKVRMTSNIFTVQEIYFPYIHFLL